MKKLRAYLAGGMSGYENNNFPLFDLYRNVLNRDTEYEVVSPADLDREMGYNGTEVVTGEQLREVLTYDIEHLLRCDAIFLMPRWRESSGARLEAHIAAALGLTLIEVLIQANRARLTYIEADAIPGHVAQVVG